MILKNDVLEMPVSCEKCCVYFLGKSSRRSRKFWIFSRIMPNGNDLGLCEHLQHFLSSGIWPPNVELSFHQVHISCTFVVMLSLCKIYLKHCRLCKIYVKHCKYVWQNWNWSWERYMRKEQASLFSFSGEPILIMKLPLLLPARIT